MTIRILFATAAVAALFAAGTAAAGTTTSTPGLHPCGTTTAAGKTWVVLAAGVPCTGAKGLIRKLAPKAVRLRKGYLGTYLGMRCFTQRVQGKTGISCIGLSGDKLVQAGTR